ncbi:MAG: dipeptidase [Candidatus Hydrogenedentes bacterium]|nr:dipeptidase [Candidatus Hydrogenedentota bacterium]
MTASVDPVEAHAAATVIDGTNPSVYDRTLLERLRAGGVTAVNATVAIVEGFARTVALIRRWEHFIETNGDLAIQVRSVDDIAAAKAQGKLGILFGLQNTAAIEEELDLLSALRDAGVRVMQLTYNERSLVGDGCFERVDAGLTRFGVNVVKRMNDEGVLIDLSHVGDVSTRDAIELSEKPVAITHSSPRALFDYPRNKPDDLIRLLADKGGVFGCTFWPFFLKNGMGSTLADYVDTIDYAVGVAGIDHVSIASDFFLNRSKEELQRLRAGRSRDWRAIALEWPVVYPEGIAAPEEYPNITAELLRRGYSAEEAAKIMGGNLVRLFNLVW